LVCVDAMGVVGMIEFGEKIKSKLRSPYNNL
jgi:hypothetical protein